MSGIYLIHVREFVRNDENIFKIGRSENLSNRAKSYPKGSYIILQIECSDIVNTESELLKIFKEKFVQKAEIGREYFKGNKLKMVRIITEYINDHNEKKDIDVENYNSKVKKTVYNEKIKKIEELYNQNDSGYVKLYYDNFKDILVYSPKIKKSFYMFNDSRKLWELKTHNDIIAHFLDKIKELINPLMEYYKKLKIEMREKKNHRSEHEINNKIKEIKTTSAFNNVSKAKSLLNLITAIFRKEDFVDKLNTNKYLLPVKNGNINLKTGQLQERRKEDLFSFELDIIWRGLDYKTPIIDKFMKNTALDNERIMYLQKLLGYSITGYTNESQIIIWEGDNVIDKNTLLDALKKMMGPYCKLCDENILTPSNKSMKEMEPLLNTRLAFIDFSDMNKKLTDSMVNHMTNSKDILVKEHTGELRKFEQTCQLFILTDNNLTTNLNPNTYKTVTIIPFISTSENTNINNILKENLDQFLVWLVNGSVIYFKKKLGNIGEYDIHTAVYSQFLKECTQEKEGEKIRTSTLYPVFKEWWGNKFCTKLMPIDRNCFIKEVSKHVDIKKIKFSNFSENGIENRVWTKKYEDGMDIYLQFLNECTEEKEGERIKTKELVEHCKIWWKNNISASPPGRNTIITGLKKHVDIRKIKINGISAIGINNLQINEKYLNEFMEEKKVKELN